MTRPANWIIHTPRSNIEPDVLEDLMLDLEEDILDAHILLSDCGEWERAQMRACLESRVLI